MSTIDILFGYITLPVTLPFLFVFVYLPLKGLLWGISAVYDRFTSEAAGAFEASEYVLGELARSHGGVFYRLYANRLSYQPHPKILVNVIRNFDVQLAIRVFEQFPQPSVARKRLIRGNPLAGQLMRDGFSFRVSPQELRVSKRLRPGEIFESTMLNTIQLVSDLAQICSRFVDIPVQKREAVEHCAYCKEAIQQSIAVVCSQCRAPHHAECFSMEGKCSVFGCASASFVGGAQPCALYSPLSNSLLEMDS